MPLPALLVAPEVVASIVGATTVAAVEIGNAAKVKGGSPVYAVLSNKSKSNFKIQTWSPTHGHTFESPSMDLYGAGWVQGEFNKAVEGEYGPAAAEADSKKELATWIRDGIFEKYAEKCVTNWGGVGDGAGFEQVILLQTPDEGNACIVLLIRKIPGGSYGGGISMSNGGWLDVAGKKTRDNIIKHIKNVHTGLCQYSDGGSSIQVQLGGLRVRMQAPGEKIEFEITNA